MNQNELASKWMKRYHNTDERVGPFKDLLWEFVEDIEQLTIEQSPQEIADRELISKVAKSIRDEIVSTGNKIKL